MSAGWHIVTDAGSVTLCRHLPPRFDVSATTHLPRGRAIRLAHQIRQDLWRALATLRGFSPVVRLDPTDDGWSVTAGGRIAGRVAPSVRRTIETLLDDNDIRTRWVQHAQVRP